MEEKEKYFPAVVIGAGAAGLRAAFDLADLGERPLVVERSEAAGGRLLDQERWFALDSCGFCRLLDGERRPILPLEEDEIMCLRRRVARRDLEVWTGTSVTAAEKRDGGLILDLMSAGWKGERIKCDCAIVSTGLDETDLGHLMHLGASGEPDVITAARFEEMLSNLSPGSLIAPSSERRIERVAFVGCAGSRDTKNPWCSSTCCGYLAKEISLLRKIEPQVSTYLVCMDLRLSGKGMYLYGEHALEGTTVVRGKAASVERTARGSLKVMAVLEGKVQEIDVDLVVLSGGAKPARDGIFSILGVKTDADGFPLPVKSANPAGTSNPLVFAAGSCRGPCDIATSVIMGRAASAGAFELVRKKRKETGEGDPAIPGNVLVIGAGISGLSAARTVLDMGHNVTILEKESEAGGLARSGGTDRAGRDLGTLARMMEKEIESAPGACLLMGVEALKILGRAGDFSVATSGGAIGGFDTVVVASGAELHVDARLDGRRILTLKEAEATLSLEGWEGGDVVFIQCVGSREAAHPYCNRVCCSKAAEIATLLARKGKGRAWILYRDMVMPGTDERLYTEAREAGVLFIRFAPGGEPALRRSPEGKPALEVVDSTVGRKIILHPGIVVLSSGLKQPGEDLARLAVPSEDDGFAAEDDARFRPCASRRPGVYVAGNARCPSTSLEAAASGVCAAAGASILARLIRNLKYDIASSRTKKNLCAGCALCVDSCPAGARFLGVGPGKAAEVLEHLCQACGQCESVCPSGAAVVIDKFKAAFFR